MRILPFIVVAGCITELPEVDRPCDPWDQTGLFEYKTEVAGDKRKAWVYMPDSAGPRDMVFVLHGAGVDARTMGEATEHMALARKEGFVAVFPQGTKPFLRHPSWNAGECCLSADENERDVDDIAFLDQLAAELEERTCSDRILATGFSNGGMLSHRWACTSDKVDAAVPAAGGLVWDGGCKGEPIPMRHYHGDADPIIPLAGVPKEGLPPLKQSLVPWLERNQCSSGDPIEVREQGTMTCEILDCAAPTELCILAGWKHQWPGGINASQLDGIDATVDGWAFFEESLGAKGEEPKDPTATDTQPTDTGTQRR